MYFIRDLHNIQHHRGDSLEINFKIFSNELLDFKEYIPEDGDEVYWALMEPNQPWEHALVKKKLDITNLKVSLKPTDTLCLYPDQYYYQFKMRTAAGDVYTLCPKTSFFILE